ncbi:hypothetical protein [Leptospira santarosai]|uniref:hypothetical protein n=1 Tax=Leptospira santarosai TaxID=28183 RepID=UPI0002BDEEC7|nr:hypothetical protein [Leptospira santarosai]EMO72820.1 hypothetical protein LEP1GSC130_1853 [Leptospira santarosai str. 200403458]EMO99695.1 hypothetical protein LEP1GSC120_1003 [Leptospira santarosai str. 200702252]
MRRLLETDRIFEISKKGRQSLTLRVWELPHKIENPHLILSVAFSGDRQDRKFYFLNIKKSKINRSHR